MIEPGIESEEPVIGIDFYPTFLNAAGIGKPENYLLDGLSLLTLFKLMHFLDYDKCKDLEVLCQRPNDIPHPAGAERVKGIF